MQIHYIEKIRAIFATNDSAMLGWITVCSFLMLGDIVTGWWKSIVTHKANSDIGTRGLMKHLSIILLLFLFGIVMIIAGDLAIEVWYGMVFSYVIWQLQSMVENVGAISKAPDFFKPAFEVLKKYMQK